MDKNTWFAVSFVVLVVLVLVFTLGRFNANGNAVNTQVETISENANNLGLETKYSEGEVTIEITPKTFSNNELSLEMGANTHTVELSQFDLLELVTLNYGGNEIKPKMAPKLSGHHNSGILVFELNEMPDSFSITINGIPDVNERIFEWI